MILQNYSSLPFYSSFFGRFYHITPNAPLLLNSLMLNLYDLDPIMWTLRFEIVATIFFPIMYFVYKQTRFVGIILLCSLTTYIAYKTTAQDDLHYIFAFCLGLLLLDAKIAYAYILQRRFITTIFLVGAILVLLLSRSFFLSPGDELTHILQSYTGFVITGMAIYASSSSRLSTTLSHRFLQFFCKISYSLYLVHFIILFLLATVLSYYLEHIRIGDNELIINLLFAVLGLGLASVVAYMLTVQYELTIQQWVKKSYTLENN